MKKKRSITPLLVCFIALMGCSNNARIEELEARVGELEAKLQQEPAETELPEAIQQDVVKSNSAKLQTRAAVFLSEFIAENEEVKNESNAMDEYFIKIRIKNIGDETISFDTALLEFTPTIGKSLTNRVTIDESNDDQDSQREKATDWTLKPDETLDLEARTNGYTQKIVDDAGELPILFQITILEGGDKVVEYHATLPKLDSLEPIEANGTTTTFEQGSPLDLVLKKGMLQSGRSDRVY